MLIPHPSAAATSAVVPAVTGMPGGGPMARADFAFTTSHA
jgi:hypothetical protein